MASQLAYDGIDVCASRVAWEVDQAIARIEEEGRRVTRFSVTGYSLGGRGSLYHMLPVTLLIRSDCEVPCWPAALSFAVVL